jgi:hypothetical protein
LSENEEKQQQNVVFYAIRFRLINKYSHFDIIGDGILKKIPKLCGDLVWHAVRVTFPKNLF